MHLPAGKPEEEILKWSRGKNWDRLCLISRRHNGAKAGKCPSGNVFERQLIKCVTWGKIPKEATPVFGTASHASRVSGERPIAYFFIVPGVDIIDMAARCERPLDGQAADHQGGLCRTENHTGKAPSV